MKFNKEKYAKLKAMAKEHEVYTASSKISDFCRYNGVAVAFGSALQGGRCKMLLVAVSYCAAADQFSKKVGKCEALDKYFNSEVIQLPLGQLLRYEGPDAVADILLEMFSYV